MRIAQRVKNLREVIPLIAPRQNRLAYIGANDLTNLGDRGMLDVHRQLLPDHSVVRFPAGTRNRLLHMYETIFRRPPVQAVLLGGGTLVGRDAYLRRLRGFEEAFPGLPRFTLGVGVEDPSFGHGRTDWDQMRRWAQLLERFEVVSVRGPRSKDILEEVGVESSVIGDPALMLGPPAPAPAEEGLVGLNAGIVSDLWGDDPDLVLSALAEFGRAMASRGRRVRVFTTWGADLHICRALVSQIGAAAELVIPESPAALLDSVKTCEVVVGVKLHAVVFASAAYVPTVMIDYRPKCSDFHESIGMGNYTVRTDQVSAGWLCDAVDDLVLQRDQRVTEIKDRVGRLRSRFEFTAGRVRDHISNPSHN